MKKAIQPIAEYGPIISFFLVYFNYYQDIILATIVIVYTTLLALSFTYLVLKKVPVMPLIAATVVSLFGGLTIYSGDGIFIKIKPTIVNLVFASILLAGIYKGKGLLKHLLESALVMTDDAWKSLSLRFAFFFMFLACLNEVVWRNFSEEFWVSFRFFGFLSITFIFMLSQIPFLHKNMIEEENKDESNV